LAPCYQEKFACGRTKHGKIALIRFEPSLEYTTLRYFIPEYVDYHSQRVAEASVAKGLNYNDDATQGCVGKAR
jgi:hypothetical protein